jgi:hypothetical protein
MCPVDFRPTVIRKNLKQDRDLCTGCADGHDIKEPCNVDSSNIGKCYNLKFCTLLLLLLFLTLFKILCLPIQMDYLLSP